MKLQHFFEAQERLDAKVVEVHGLEDKNLTADVTQALYTELGELSNEIGFFKYWKKNKKDDKARQWDEWADCWHFILSLGNKYGHSDKLREVGWTSFHGEPQYFHKAFSNLYSTDYSVLHQYIRALRMLMAIGHYIGMTEADMEKAYFDKNTVNYERLSSGY